MNLYENLLPEKPIPGHLGYYPICNEKEWNALPIPYKVMEWNPVKDPHNKGHLSAVKSVIFDVVHMEPYKINAKVSVHPEDVQKILFCNFKKTDCQIYSVCGIELENGTKLSAKWYQDSVSGAFAIYAAGEYVGIQGGFRGHIPGHVKCLEDGSFKYDFQYGDGKTNYYTFSNPFSGLSEKYISQPENDDKITVFYDENKEFSSKERLMTLAQLIVDSCSHDEIDMLCTALLDANLQIKLSVDKEKKQEKSSSLDEKINVAVKKATDMKSLSEEKSISIKEEGVSL